MLCELVLVLVEEVVEQNVLQVRPEVEEVLPGFEEAFQLSQ